MDAIKCPADTNAPFTRTNTSSLEKEATRCQAEPVLESPTSARWRGSRLEEFQSLLRIAEQILRSPDPIPPTGKVKVFPTPTDDGENFSAQNENCAVSAIDIVVQLRRMVSEQLSASDARQQRFSGGSSEIPVTVLGRAQRVLKRLEMQLYSTNREISETQEDDDSAELQVELPSNADVAQRSISGAPTRDSQNQMGRFRFRVPYPTTPMIADTEAGPGNAEVRENQKSSRLASLKIDSKHNASVHASQKGATQMVTKPGIITPSNSGTAGHEHTVCIHEKAAIPGVSGESNSEINRARNCENIPEGYPDFSNFLCSTSVGRMLLQDLDNATVVKGPNELQNVAPDIAVSNASNSKIILSDMVSALRLFSVKDSLLIIPRVETSVFINNASNSVVLLGGAQQLRIHNSTDLQILMPGFPALFPRSIPPQSNDTLPGPPIISSPIVPVIEGCERVQFGILPFVVTLKKAGTSTSPAVEREKSVVDLQACQWKPVERVVDFNWHRTDEASPHWSRLNSLNAISAITGVSYEGTVEIQLSETRAGQWTVAEDEPLLLGLQALMSFDSRPN